MGRQYLLGYISVSFIALMSLFNLNGMVSYEDTTLPAPEKDQVSESDMEMLKFVATLPVYKDDTDINHYYYVPIFKVKNFEEGAASIVFNENQVKNFSELSSLSKKKYSVATSMFFDLSNSLQTYETMLQTEMMKPSPSESMVSLLKAQISDFRKMYKEVELKSNESSNLIPLGIRYAINGRMYEILAMSGIYLGDINAELEKAFSPKVAEAISDLAKSDGGFFSLNIYAGFSDKQVNYLKTYKQKFFPNVKISPIPVDKLSFKQLSENFYDENGKTKSRGIPVFSSVKGSGGFAGATVSLNMTVGGSSSFARNLSNFHPPVGIMATFKQQAPPFEAILDCKISNGFAIKGRSDQRDGLVIYNDDVVNKFKSTDNNNSDCKLDLISGNRDSAEFMALTVLQQELDKLFQERMVMSKKEKDEYYQKNVQNDIDTHHHTGANNSWNTIFAGRWTGFFIGLASNVSKFYWHTNVQDVEFMSNIVIKKHIRMKGYTNIERDIPAPLCLTYNIQKRAYVGCKDDKRSEAKTLNESNLVAEKSPQCRDLDAIECGEARQNRSPADSDGNIIDF